MNPNIRNNSTFPRIGSSHQNRHGHHSRWHVNHIPFSKDFQQGYSQGSNNDRDKDMFGFPKPPGAPTPPGAFALEAAAAPDVRQLPPPLLLPQRPQVAENPVSLLNGPLLNLNINSGLLAPIENTEFQQRPPPPLQPEMRHNPVPPTSSPFFRPPNGQDDGRKDMCAPSESPSRKRRRLVQNQQQGGSTMPLPAHHQSPWEPRRNPRQPPRNSIPVRRGVRYQGSGREWPQENQHMARMPHPPAFPPPHPSTSHHQPPIVMDLSQVPVSLPLPLYSSGPTPPAHLPPCQVHSIYCTTSPQHTSQLQSFGGCLSHHTGSHHHHHHHAGSVLFPSLAHVHYSAHLAPPPPPPPRHDQIEIDIIVDHHHRPPPPHQTTILQMPAASSIFISEVPRRASGRRWNRPFQPPSPFPGWLHILAMFSNPPLSPYSQDVTDVHHQPENYEDFLSLADRLGDAKPRGLNKAEIDQLPSFKYSCEGGEGDKTSCVICLCDFESRQTLRGLPCSHQFHAKCIDKWLKSNPTCPICRGDASGYVMRSE